MTLRRLLVAAPLALLVAVLAHLAAFGGAHQLGGEHGAGLLASALAALFALAGLGALAVALTRPSSAGAAVRQLRTALPGAGEVAPFAAWLFAGSLVAFCGLELLEGHAPLAAAWVLPVAGALALATALAVRAALRCVARAGLALAALAGELNLGRIPSFVPLAPSGVYVKASAPGGVRRGRAPPRTV